MGRANAVAFDSELLCEQIIQSRNISSGTMEEAFAVGKAKSVSLDLAYIEGAWI